MLERSPQQLVAVVVSLLVVTGMIPAVAVGAFTENATEPQEAISGSDFRDASNEVEVWEKAVIPLRANPQVNADTQFRSVDLRASVDDLGINNVPLDKGRTAVYGTNAEIQLEFDNKSYASTSGFANQESQLLVAHIEEDTEAARELFGSDTALTAKRALDLLTGENINNNASFVMENVGTLDSNGELTHNHQVSQGSGFYVFFLVQDHKDDNNWGVTDQGFEVTNGELSVENKSRILGVDVATVHQRRATASPDRSLYNPGSDIYFDVDARQNSGQVTHAIAVYKRTGNNGFEGKDVTVEITGALDENFSSDQVTVRREIKDVNGVATVSGNPNIMGLGNLKDGQVSGVTSGAGIIDFIAEQANTDDPLDATTSNPTTLDASVTVIDDPDDEASLTVETFENWSTGQYGYVYIATGADSSEITTTRGTINLNPSRVGSSPVRNNGPTEIEFNNADISKIGISFGNEVSGDLRVEQRVSPSDGVPSIKRNKGLEDPVYMDITVSGGADGSRATIEATVKKSRLKGLPANKVSIWHYTGGKWVELTTKIVSQDTNTVTLRATTDSFSPFALAEATTTNEPVETTQPNNNVDDGPSVSSSSGGGGGISLGSRTLYAITDFITGGSSADISVGGSSKKLVRVSMTFFDETAGQVRVEERNQPSLDENYDRNYDDTILAVVDIKPPSRVASEPGSITFEIRRSAVDALGVTTSGLQIQQFDSENGTWETLPTEVVETEGSTVTLRTDVPSFGTYIISTVPDSAAGGSTSGGTPESEQSPAADQSDADDDVQTMTGTATLRPGETARPAETTSTEFPGLGISAALVAFVLALVLGWRRRQ